MLNIFDIGEILITKKGYRRYVMTELPEYLSRPKIEKDYFKSLIKNTELSNSRHGKYWRFKNNVVHIPNFMK